MSRFTFGYPSPKCKINYKFSKGLNGYCQLPTFLWPTVEVQEPRKGHLKSKLHPLSWNQTFNPPQRLAKLHHGCGIPHCSALIQRDTTSRWRCEGGRMSLETGCRRLEVSVHSCEVDSAMANSWSFEGVPPSLAQHTSGQAGKCEPLPRQKSRPAHNTQRKLSLKEINMKLLVKS